MNRRERVIAAIEHHETDHVPCNFHAVPQVWNRMLEHYGYTHHDEFFRFLNNHIIKVGDDFNRNPKRMDQDIHNHRDVFGCVWDISHGDMGHPKSFPLMNQRMPSLKGFDWPDPINYWDFDEMEHTVRKWKGEVFIFGKIGECLFERAWIVRGMEQLFMDLIDNPDFVEELMEKILWDFNMPILQRYVEMDVDGIYLGDDWGTSSALMFSKEMWDRFCKPRLKIMYDFVRQHNLYLGIHVDGVIDDVLEDLLDMGVQIINPAAPTVTDIQAVKQKHGHRMTWYGGICVERTIPFGTPEQIVAEIHERAEILGKGGGYILQSSHTIHKDVPIENVCAYIEGIREVMGLETSRE